jgi:hypothetical protein
MKEGRRRFGVVLWWKKGGMDSERKGRRRGSC